jgi:hypothetical protein
VPPFFGPLGLGLEGRLERLAGQLPPGADGDEFGVGQDAAVGGGVGGGLEFAGHQQGLLDEKRFQGRAGFDRVRHEMFPPADGSGYPRLYPPLVRLPESGGTLGRCCLRCFLHGWLDIRSRGKPSEAFHELSGKVWEAYHAPNRRSFAQRLRRVLEWARGQPLSAWLLEQVQKLCGRSAEYGLAYEYPGGHRTSNMLDRLMRGMNRYFEDCQHLHGSAGACELHVRAWALLQNFRPWGPEAVRANDDWRCPAERLNENRYHDDWLQNLQVSASLGGFRR